MESKRGFTLIELLGAVIIISLLFLVAIPAVQKYITKGGITYYTSIEGEMKAAGMDYLETYRTLLPLEIGSVTSIPLDELVANKYIDQVKDKNGNICEGAVAVKKIKKGKYEYSSCLRCGDDYTSYSETNDCRDHTEYVDSGDYIIEGICTDISNCEIKVCDSKNNCKDPEPAVCPIGSTADCKIRIQEFDISASTIVVEQAIGTLQVPYGQAYYIGNPDKKIQVIPKPTRVDTSKLGTKEVIYEYKGATKIVNVIIVDKKKPTKPEIALRKDSVIGNSYLSSTWYSGNVVALFKSYDYAAKGLMGSGVKQYEISANNADFTVLDAPFELRDNEGEYTRYIRSRDKANPENVSEVNQYTYRIDKTSPNKPSLVINGTPKQDGSGKKWYKTPVTVTITHNDDVLPAGVNKFSGVKNIKYMLTDATAENYKIISNNGRVPITNNGRTTVIAKVTDNADNVSSEESIEVYVDQIAPPEPIISVEDGTMGVDWYRTPVKLKFTHKNDNCQTNLSANSTPNICSGVEKMTYKVVGSGGAESETKEETTIAQNGTITLSEEGIMDVTVYVYDWAGNVSSKSLKVKIDRTAPLPPSLVASPITSNTNWTTSNVQVLITPGTDLVNRNGQVVTTSGVLTTPYAKASETSGLGENEASSINGTAAKTISVKNSGVTSITAYTQDAAGNTSTPVTIRVYIDKMMPESMSINISGTTGTNGWYKAGSSVRATIVDNGDRLSGYNRTTYSYKVNGTVKVSETTGTTFEIPEESDNIEITAKGYDNVSNVRTVYKTIKIDKTKPPTPKLTVTSGTTGSNGWYKSGSDVKVKIELNGNDNLSGICRLSYTLSGAKNQGETDVSNGTQVTINADGTTTITAYTYDCAGNKSDETSMTLNVDLNGPYCSGISGQSTTWTNSNRTLYWGGGDYASGLASGGGSKTYTATQQYDTIGSYTLRDNAGNTTTCCIGGCRVNVFVDKTPPVCDSEPSGQSTTWKKGTRIITWGGTDADSGPSTIVSGVQSYNATITTDYIAPYTLTDAAGNQTQCRPSSGSYYVVNVYVDNTAPECHLGGTNRTWTNGNVGLSWAYNDAHSGPTTSQGVGTATIDYTAKTYYISDYTVMDNVGNTKKCSYGNVDVYVDKTAPTCSISKTASGENGVSITGTCSDGTNESGVATCNGMSGTSFTASNLTSSKTYTVTDGAGNSGTCKATITTTTEKGKQMCKTCKTTTGDTCLERDACITDYDVCVKTDWYYVLVCDPCGREISWQSIGYSGSGQSTSQPNATCDCNGTQGQARNTLTKFEWCEEYGKKTDDSCSCIKWNGVEDCPSLGCAKWKDTITWGKECSQADKAANKCRNKTRTIYDLK